MTRPPRPPLPRRSPVDQDDALAKLDRVAEREGEAPGELFDTSQGLDVEGRPAAAAAAAFLLPPQTSEEL